MIPITIPRGIVAKGFGGAPAISISQSGKMLSFSVGIPRYDKDAPNNTRWVNLKIKAFEPLVTRIRNMKVDANHHLTITGDLDIETWQDSQTGEQRSRPAVTALAVDFAGGGNSQNNGSARGNAAPGGAPASDPNDQGDIHVDSQPSYGNDDFDDDDDDPF